MAEPRYREYPLPPPLDAFVSCIWHLSHGGGAGASLEVQRIPPDGSTELIFHLGDTFRQVADDGTRPQPAAMIVGVWTQPIAIVAPRHFDTVGVRIRPGCASAFWSEPATRFTNTVIDAASVLGPEVSRVRDRLGEVGDRERVAMLSAFLLERQRRHGSVPAKAIDLIVRTKGRTPIDAVARQAGVSHRRLERAFLDHVGVSAKMLSRIVRFQQVLRHSRPETAGAWADVALACGYTDQSHLIRDFAQFTGTTPFQLSAADPELADYFRRR